MDLKQWNGRWILHMIDMWSRYTVSVFIDRKKTTCVIEKMMTNWIGIFGVMGTILTDNGGVFSSDEMSEVASILNVKVYTAGESPFQNGLCERVHAITDTMLMKLEADYRQVNDQSLLCWANMARNALQMWNGFSSHQLVFGLNPNLPNILKDTLPALEGRTSSEEFAKHLKILHDSGNAYIQSESDERIRRALRGKIRASEQIFDHDINFREQIDNIETPDTNETGNHETRYTYKNNEVSRVEKKDCFSELLSTSKERIPQMENIQAQIIPNLKENDKIQYKLPNSNTWTKATVLSKAGKTTRKNKHWYNVQDDIDEDKKSVDLDKVEWEKVTGDSHENEIGVNMTNSSFLNEEIAKQIELSNLHNFDTYEECDDIGQNALSTRWVITTKNNQRKARFVRGFEEEFTMQRDSPTVGKGIIKIFLSITASMKWIFKTRDIKSAFLQGKILDRDVFLKPPPESNSKKGKIWRLKHCLYGLEDGARQFYLSVREELLSLGYNQCSLDPAVFVKHTDQRLSGIICWHVDGFLHSGDEKFEKDMRKLRTRFVAGKIEEKNFSYVGFQIHQKKNGIILDHSTYMEKIDNTTIEPSISDDEEPLHNDTDNDENQENVEGSADESAADSADQDDSHAGSQNGSLNGEDSPESDERDSLDLAENDIHEESMEHNAESQANDSMKLKDQMSDDENEDVLLSDIDFTEAKEAELDNWRKHNVYEEVEDNGQNCISTKWVYTMKELENEFHRKATLVAKGFEEDSLDEIPKNSPTSEKQSLRLILSIIANKRWSINSVDIKTAFLQGEKMQREVYLRPPKEAKANVYGLADASLKWYEKVKTTLLDCGGTVSKFDSAVFYWYNEKCLTGVLTVHVDDFLWAGSSSFEESVLE
ncbi:unnamed protein product [Mytilus coruscus]|uniref:Integrase catalytic domain-containing protein n=1 Tax=Mytilus coruscus TaxID=42192 RepID=A0A6J8E6F4_MYTCO|nr:unnamed protein product [Mytilus coruscus]